MAEPTEKACKKAQPCAKTQPWRIHWPPTNTTSEAFMGSYKPGERLAIDGGGGTGIFGLNDKNEGIRGN